MRTSPYLVASNASINLGTAAGALNPNGNGPASGTIPAVFPKGYNAFWIMKYECSQQQYADFLNHLDLARATVNQPTIFTGTHPNLIAPEPNGGIGELGFNRAAALSDWSGLRPLSELEFEKACRGYNTPAVPNEYVWGNTTISPVTGVSNQGAEDEAVSTPSDANANIAHGFNAITRVGIFARASGSTRVLSGSTYYGVMNMGDNLYEVCFSMVDAKGRAIDESINGDGYLDQDGTTDIAAWKENAAYGLRGGSYIQPIFTARTSERADANFFVPYSGDNNASYCGVRMVRVAP
jgi:formylglycine-generating enzyme required for sulfatase activity